MEQKSLEESLFDSGVMPWELDDDLSSIAALLQEGISFGECVEAFWMLKNNTKRGDRRMNIDKQEMCDDQRLRIENMFLAAAKLFLHYTDKRWHSVEGTHTVVGMKFHRVLSTVVHTEQYKMEYNINRHVLCVIVDGDFAEKYVYDPCVWDVGELIVKARRTGIERNRAMADECENEINRINEVMDRRQP